MGFGVVLCFLWSGSLRRHACGFWGGALLSVVWFVKETRVWVLGWCFAFCGLVREGDTHVDFGLALCFLWSAVILFSYIN